MDPSRSSFATLTHAPYANELAAHHRPIHSYASAPNMSSRAASAPSYQQEQPATFAVDLWSHHPRQGVSYPASHTSAAQEFAPNYASLPCPTTQTPVSWSQSPSWNGFSMANSPPYWMSANATSFPFPESASSSSYIPADSVRPGTASSAESLYTRTSAFPSPAEPYSCLGHVKLEQNIEEYPFPGFHSQQAGSSVAPTSDEGDWYPSSLADLQPAAAPKCVPLRITGASADMRRQMGVFRLDPFAMHDGVHAAVKRPPSPNEDSGGLTAPSALRLRDQAICWNGEHAGPLKEPSVLVEFQARLKDPENLVPYQVRYAHLYDQVDHPSSPPKRAPGGSYSLHELALEDAHFAFSPEPEESPVDQYLLRQHQHQQQYTMGSPGQSQLLHPQYHQAAMQLFAPVSEFMLWLPPSRMHHPATLQSTILGANRFDNTA